MKKLVVVVAMVVQPLQWLRILLRLSLQLKKQKAQRKQQLLSLQRKNRKLKNRHKMPRLMMLPLQQKLLLSLPNKSKHTILKSHPHLCLFKGWLFRYTLFQNISNPFHKFPIGTGASNSITSLDTG